jgi:hypothetical protein
MSTHEHPPWRVRHLHAYEIEFACPTTSPSPEPPSKSAPTSLGDPLADERHQSIRARLLDPRLQRIIAAAANGWVVERLR